MTKDKGTYYARNREARLAYQKKYREQNKDKIAERKKKYRANNKEKIKMQVRQRKYDIEPKDWHSMLKSQGSRCAICGTEDPQHKYGWHTDHDHETGEVRGILCGRCNNLLGRMGDTYESVYEMTQAMLKYLE